MRPVRLRITERQVLLLLLSATALAVAAAVVWGRFFGLEGHPIIPAAQARVRWLRPTENVVRQKLAEYFDPSLMSLPSPHGFSQGVWQRLALPTASRYLPVIPPAFLPAPAKVALPVLLPQPDLTAVIQTELARPELDLDRLANVPGLEPVAALTNSVVVFSGPLAERRVQSAPVLPMANNEGAVRRTHVWLGVSPDGRVQHTVLEQGCGNEGLDLQAIELARQFRFEPQVNPDPLALQWGRGRFFWVTPAGK